SPALSVVPKQGPSGFEFGKARETAATTPLRIRDSGDEREDYLVRIIRWILRMTSAIPCEDRHTTREGLLVCDTVSYFLVRIDCGVVAAVLFLQAIQNRQSRNAYRVTNLQRMAWSKT